MQKARPRVAMRSSEPDRREARSRAGAGSRCAWRRSGGAGALSGCPKSTAKNEEPRRVHMEDAACASAKTRKKRGNSTEALRQAGIESWIEGQAQATRAMSGLGARWQSASILSPADRLEEARADRRAIRSPKRSSSNPKCRSPSSKRLICPKCGAGDPILEGVDPVNSGSARPASTNGRKRPDGDESPERPE